MGRNQFERAPDSIDPTGFWRFVFWLVLVLGALSLLLEWGLTWVPRPAHDDHTPDYIILSCSAALTLISILMGRWLWGIKNPFVEQQPITGMRLVLRLAWFLEAMAVIWVIGATFHR
jgi:hypothetical protein